MTRKKPLAICIPGGRVEYPEPSFTDEQIDAGLQSLTYECEKAAHRDLLRYPTWTANGVGPPSEGLEIHQPVQLTSTSTAKAVAELQALHQIFSVGAGAASPEPAAAS
jgi:hypothetical protein